MYPQGEVRAAVEAAQADGVTVPWGAHPHDVVRRLERGGYLPRDRARVLALVDRATTRARASVNVRAQLVLPFDGPARADARQLGLF